MNLLRSTEQIDYHTADSDLGCILAACSQQGIVLIALGDTRQELIHYLQQHFPGACWSPQNSQLQQALVKIRRYIESPQNRLDLVLDIRGTLFQRQVWNALLEIPLGSRCSYGQIARQIGAPKAVRAVAAACAANRLALAIPCHRVISANGKLSGYRWGTERKAALLSREAAIINDF
jgi:AraC family transcriptional regulator of adaptative response/methylated-DNA-[protein]-cysteine methyltransferase